MVVQMKKEKKRLLYKWNAKIKTKLKVTLIIITGDNWNTHKNKNKKFWKIETKNTLFKKWEGWGGGSKRYNI